MMVKNRLSQTSVDSVGWRGCDPLLDQQVCNLGCRDVGYDGPKMYLLNEKAVGEVWWPPESVLLSKCSSVLTDFGKELKKIINWPPSHWLKKAENARTVALCASPSEWYECSYFWTARIGPSRNPPWLGVSLLASCCPPGQWVLSPSRLAPETSPLAEICTSLVEAAGMWRGSITSCEVSNYQHGLTPEGMIPACPVALRPLPVFLEWP